MRITHRMNALHAVVGLLRAAHDRLALRVDLLALREELGLELRHPLVLRLLELLLLLVERLEREDAAAEG